MSLKELSFAGSFYPSQKFEILDFIEFFNNRMIDENIPQVSLDARAVIVPHAGYVYSGYSANQAYKSIKNRPKRFIVIGPSHHSRFDGIATTVSDIYPSPLGDIEIDTAYIEDLRKRFDIGEFVGKEHSTEVQMPLIKHYFDGSKVIELVYSAYEASKLKDLVEYLLEDEDNIVVISTDLSHYYDISTANNLDSKCLEAVKDMSIPNLKDGCEACGILGVYALLKSSIEMNLSSQVLSYTTSADASGDSSSVVGYMSAIVY